MLWHTLLDWARISILTAAQLYGGNLGAGILTVSTILRLALLPLTLYLGRRAAEQQARLARIQPQLTKLRSRYAGEPDRLWRETTTLYRREGVKPFDPAGLLGSLVQLPLLGAFFAAIRSGVVRGARFLWVADLARPDIPLTLITSLIAGTATYLSVRGGPQPPASSASLLVGVTVLSVAVSVWFAGAGFAISVIGSGAVNVFQTLLLFRGRKRAA